MYLENLYTTYLSIKLESSILTSAHKIDGSGTRVT